MAMEWIYKDHVLIVDEILNNGHLGHEEILENLQNKFGDKLIEKLLRQNHVQIIPCLGTKNDPEQAALILSDEISKLEMTRTTNDKCAESFDPWIFGTIILT